MIDEQIRDQLVREYLDKTNAALNDFDVALGNVSSDTSKASSEFSRLLAAFSVLRVQGRGLETIFSISRYVGCASIWMVFKLLSRRLSTICNYIPQPCTKSSTMIARKRIFEPFLEACPSARLLI